MTYRYESYTPFPAGLNETATSTGTGPKAYLNWLVYDRNYNLIAGKCGYAHMTTAARETGQDVAHEKLTGTITIGEAGYVYIYLSNEETSPVEVYFDDFKVTHTKTNIIQYNEYYPFGLQTSRSWTRTGSKNNFLANSGTEQNATSGWYDLTYRNYDPVLCRFIQIDPMAQKYGGWSPYNYAVNNPAIFTDPSGLEYENAAQIRKKKLEEAGYHVGYKGGFYGSESSMGGGWSNGGYVGYNAGDYYDFYRGQIEAARMLLEQAQAGNAYATQQYAREYGRAIDPYSKYGLSLIYLTNVRLQGLKSLGDRKLAVNNLNNDFVELDSHGNIYVPYTNVSYWDYINQRGQTQGGSQFTSSNRQDWNPWFTAAGGVVSAFDGGNSIAIHQLENGGKFIRLSQKAAYTGANTFGKALGVVGVGITIGQITYEIKHNQANTHTLVNGLVTGGTFIVGTAAVIFGAPVIATGAAIVGIGYGVFSLFGGDDLINDATNNWGRSLIYSDK